MTTLLARLASLSISIVVRTWDIVGASFRKVFLFALEPKAVVVYYHAVRTDQRRRFARQMDLLQRLAQPFQAGCLDPVPTSCRYMAAVTFDDGFESVLENAVPELTKRNIPFVLFVPSGCLGRQPSWVPATHPSFTERVLSESKLSSLASNGLCVIGSHSVTHSNLATLGSSRLSEELIRSKADLEAALGRSIDVFSFPYGAATSATYAAARRAGYRRVFTIEPECFRSTADAFVVGRFAVDPDDWRIEFHLKLVGAYRWHRHYSSFIKAISWHGLNNVSS
jgi:peptidoglycan/xylan/chitin deacetylase (PgdA/CDA1 family)